MLEGFHAYMAYSTANHGPRMFESSVLKMRKLETGTEVVSDYIIYMGTTCCLQTNTFPWISRIPPKIHALSAALNGRINSQISLEIFD